MGSDGEGMTRLEYLRLLAAGYAKDGAVLPDELRAELALLEIKEALEKAKAAEKLRIEAEEALRKRAVEWEESTGHEADLMEYWHLQRQHGRTKAAEMWWAKHGIQPWQITEIKEKEINDEANLRRAKRQQGLG